MSDIIDTSAMPRDLQLATALALCARATVAWYTESGRAEALGDVMTAMASLTRATHGSIGARKPHEFLDLLGEPLSRWLPLEEDECLVEHGEPSSLCHDLVAEAGDDPAAELAQAAVGNSRAAFARRPDGEREYRAFRKYLVTHGHASRRDAMRAIAASGVGFGELFEEVPGNSRLDAGGTDAMVPCPRCTWPMRVAGPSVVCRALRCRADGAQFRVEESGTLRPLGGLAAPEPVAVGDRVCLRRGVWRYTLLPGLAELELAGRLEALPGVELELWPQRDKYDLLVESAGRTWLVDVKDWSDPVALSRRLLQQAPAEQVWIVVPDYRQRQVAVLEQRCDASEWRFASASAFVRTVKRHIKEQGA